MEMIHECPEYFSMKGKDFLLFSLMNWAGHSNVLLCGQVDFESFRFQCEQLIDLNLGSDFYAAQTLPLKDGRMGVIGWLGSWGKPHPEDKYGWAGMLSSIRVVEYDQKRQEITLEPACEISVLIDGSVLELFTGKQVVSERFYLDTGNKTMKLCCPEGAALLRVKGYEMESIYRWEGHP